MIQVGVVDVDPADIATKGRLMPGNIFLVDFEAGRVIRDDEVCQSMLASLAPCCSSLLLTLAVHTCRFCNVKHTDLIDGIHSDRAGLCYSSRQHVWLPCQPCLDTPVSRFFSRYLFHTERRGCITFNLHLAMLP